MVYKFQLYILSFRYKARVWRTDGQTDGQADRWTDGQNYDLPHRASIAASRGKNRHGTPHKLPVSAMTKTNWPQLQKCRCYSRTVQLYDERTVIEWDATQSPASIGLAALVWRAKLAGLRPSITARFMSKLLKLRDNYLDFSDVFHLDQSGIATLIDFVATA